MIGDPNPQFLHARSNSAGLKGFKAAVARTMFSAKDEHGNKLKEGDFSPQKLFDVFESPQGVDYYRSLIGDTNVAVREINEMNRVAKDTREGRAAEGTIPPIPTFITRNPDVFLNDEIEGFNKAVAMMEVAKYLHAKGSPGSDQFISTLLVEMDGKDSGPALQAYEVGNYELSRATGMLNANDEYTFDGDARLRTLFGGHLSSVLSDTDMPASVPVELQPQLRTSIASVFAIDKYRKSIVQPVGYGQDPESVSDVVERFFNERGILRRDFEKMITGTEATMQDVYNYMAEVSGIGIIRTLGKETFENYLRPLNSYSLYARLMHTTPIIEFSDGAIANLGDKKIQKSDVAIGQIQYKTPLGDQGGQTPRSSIYTRENVADPLAAGPCLLYTSPSPRDS